jgi:signal transduction histidine kinase
VKGSLSSKIFWAIALICMVNISLTLITVEMIYEDLETTILEEELSNESQFYKQQLEPLGFQRWATALLTVEFLPDGADESQVSAMFQGLVVPTSQEIEVGERTYLVKTEVVASPPGRLFVADDITEIENREDRLQIAIAIAFGMLLVFGVSLAWLGARLLVNPLEKLARHIKSIEPNQGFQPIRTVYREQELSTIASSINQLLVSIQSHVDREKLLVSLASHELRTPLSVMTGALDVIDQRDSLNKEDRVTMNRVRRAAEEMRADVEALLRLARRQEDVDDPQPVRLNVVVDEVIQELDALMDGSSKRIQRFDQGENTTLLVDRSLIRMLMRNLLHNALRHTQSLVTLEQRHAVIRISDSGVGLPSDAAARLFHPLDDPRVQRSGGGLGLFIVRLICERLGWKVSIQSSLEGGTVIDLEVSASSIVG